MAWPPTDEKLNEMRTLGDPPADERVAEIFSNGGIEDIHAMMADLVEFDHIDLCQTDTHLTHFDHQIAPSSEVIDGQRVFEAHGPEILWILGCYSLPSAYAAANGVEVLAQTEFLTRQTNRRLVETSQMVVDAMTEGSLAPGARGISTIEKVRLMHAAIRLLILNRPGHDWPTDQRGLPINQEDMAGTLMTFSYLAIDGLKHLGIRLNRADRESYVAAWAYVGRRMGVTEELIPKSFKEAKRLTRLIQSRQIDPSETSRAMLPPLLAVLDHKSIPGMAAATMRLCLPRSVANGLGVPRNWLMEIFLRVVTWILGIIDMVFGKFKKHSRLYRRISMGLIESLLLVDRGGQRPQFNLPESLDWYDPQTRSARVVHAAASRLAGATNAD